jgi:hypothetical protein
VARGQRRKKERLTVSLSAETIRFLQVRQAEAQAPSMSAYLESVISDLQAKAELTAYEAATTDYYDKMSAAQIEEESEWGTIGAASLAQNED